MYASLALETHRTVFWLALLALFSSIVPSTSHAQDVGAALGQAEEWLLLQQNFDGSFGAVQALAARDSAATVLALAGRESAEPGWTRGAVYLEGTPDTSTPALALRALALASDGRDVDGLLETLMGAKNGGGMGAFRTYHSNFLDTAMAIQALALSEPQYLLEINGFLDYLQVHQGADGGWGFATGDPSALYFSAEILEALMAPGQLAVGQGTLDAVVTFLVAQQQVDGSFGDPSTTALVWRALLAADRGQDLPYGSPVPWLLSQQQANGSWENSVFTTARVVQVLRREGVNLSLADLVADPDPVALGASVTLTVTVRNGGQFEAGESRLTVHRDGPTGDLLAEATVPALAAGGSVDVELTLDTTGLTGSYVDLVAICDADDAIEETDEDDNSRSLRLALRTGADLAVFGGDLHTDPTTPRPAEAFDLRVSLRNLGESAADGSAWRVERLVDGAVVEELAAGDGGPLDAGGASVIPVSLSLDEGEHTLRVQVDPFDGLTEEREDNNSATHTFFVVDPNRGDLALEDADLHVSGGTGQGGEPEDGDSITVTLTVSNPGDRAIQGDVDLRALTSAGDTVLTTWPVDLLAGGSDTLVHTLTVDASTYGFLAVADPMGQVFELDEGNNRARRIVRSRPDLTVGYDNLTFAPTAPRAGDPVTVSVTVRNAGTADASDVDLEVFDGDPAAGGTSIFQHRFDTLAASGNGGVTFPWTAPAGRGTLVAVVDGGDAVLELSETNNEISRQIFTERANGPNLRPTGVDVAGLTELDLPPRLQGSVQVTLTNDGDAPVTGVSVVRLFEDRDGDGRFGGVDTLLGQATVDGPLAVGENHTVTVDLGDGTAALGVAFRRPLIWAEVDAGDAVAERREDDNLQALFGDCPRPTPAPGVAVPEVQWHLRDIEVENAPVVVQLSDDNGDGVIDSRDTPDVVFLGLDAEGRAVMAVSGLDATPLWTFRSSFAHPLTPPIGNLAAADLDGDGTPEILAPRRDGKIMALDHRGEVLWVSHTVEGMGDRWVGGMAVGELDGDGIPEIVVGRSVLSNTGELLALGTANRGRNYNYYGPLGVPMVPGAQDYPHAVIADIDLDGRQEVVAGDSVYRLVGNTLEVVWDHDEPNQQMVDGFSAVANLDADPEAEIVYVSSNQILVLEHDGSVARARQTLVPLLPLSRAGFWGGPPAIADLDGDGTPEILVVGETEIVALRADLSPFWTQSFDDIAAITGITAFDLDGDGAREVMALDNSTFHLLDGRDGTVIQRLPNTSKTASEMPVVADVDGDGRAEILVPSNTSFDGDPSTRGLRLLGHPSWQGARPLWNQYGFAGTNAQLDGTVPSQPVVSWSSAGSNTFRVQPEVAVEPGYEANATLSWPRVGALDGDGVPITLRVGNGGRGVLAPGSTLALYAGEPLGAPALTVAVDRGLRAGDFTDVEVLWTAPAPPGATVTAVLTPPGTNRGADDTVTFSLDAPVLPDLLVAVDGFGVPSTVERGQRVALAVTVRNAGDAVAPASVLRLHLGDPATSPVIGEMSIPDLDIDGSSTLHLVWDTFDVPEAPYTLYAVVDADATVAEVDEGNNQALAPVVVYAPIASDLRVLDLVLTPAGAPVAGTPVTATVTFDNLGADLAEGVIAALRLNGIETQRLSDPSLLARGATGSLDFVIDTVNLQGVIDLEVILDPDNTVIELDETNNAAAVELTVTPSPFAIAVTGDALGYGAGETALFTVVATHATGSAVAGQVTLWVVDSAGQTVAQVADSPWALPGGTSTDTFPWAVGNTAPGGYTVLAELRVDGAVVARGAGSLNIASEIDTSVRVFTDRSTYVAGQSAVLTALVHNGSANTLLEDLEAILRVTDLAGAELMTSTRSIPTLVPGGDITVHSTWTVDDHEPGEYSVQVDLRDSFGQLIAFGERRITVEDSRDSGAGLVGTLTVESRTVQAGVPLITEYLLSNAGNADFQGLDLRVTLESLADGANTLATRDTRLDLARDQSVHGVSTFDTDAFEPGFYLATLSARLPAGDHRLDSVLIRVERGVSIDDAEGPEGAGTLRFRVHMSSATDVPVTATVSSRDGEAVAGQDYQTTAATVTFAPGETEKFVDVPVLDDTAVEPHETFLMAIDSVDGAVVGDGQALGILRDEEGCVGPQLSSDPGLEAPPSAGTWVAVSGTWQPRRRDALEGTSALESQPGGELVQTVDLAAYAAAIDAGTLELVASAFARADDPLASSTSTLTLELLDVAANTLSTHTATGAAGVEGWQALVAQAVVPTGARQARLRLATGPDTAVAFDRTALHTMGLLALGVEDLSLLEGDTATGIASVRVTMACASPTAVSVAYATVDGVTVDGIGTEAAIAGVDYQATGGVLTLDPGETEASIDVTVLGNTLDQPDRHFGVELSPVDSSTDAVPIVDARATVTLRDDDGIARLRSTAAEASESDAAVVFEVTLDAPSGRTVEVEYATAAVGGAQGATFGSDLRATSGRLIFAPGEVSHSVSVPLIDDTLAEGDETFSLELRAPVNAEVLTDAVTGTVRDDEHAGLSVDNPWVLEGASGETTTALFTVRLSAPSSRTVTVDYTTVEVPAEAGVTPATAGVDFQTTTGQLSLSPGTSSATVAVPVLGDDLAEPRETFALALSQPVNAVLDLPEGRATVIDDDGVLVSVGDLDVREGDGDLVALVPVTLSRAATATVTVDVATSGTAQGPTAATTAEADVDFTPTTATLTFDPGVTLLEVPVTILGDDSAEDREHFRVAITTVDGAAIHDGEGTVTVLDDDSWVLVDRGQSAEGPGPACFSLTQGNVNFEVGAAWNQKTLDLRESFDKTFLVSLGDQVTTTGGMVFVLQDSGHTVGYDGNRMGYVPITPSVGVTLDLSANPDGIAVRENGSTSNNGHPAVPVGNLTDGQYHELRVIWNQRHRSLGVFYDGEEALTYRKDIVEELFGSDSEVWWGFTSAGLAHGFCDLDSCADGGPITVAAGNTSLLEGDDGTTQMHIPITLSCASDVPVTVSYATTDGTATDGLDYYGVAGQVTFAPGETDQHVTVEVISEGIAEKNETFHLDLLSVDGAEVRHGSGVQTILTDEIRIRPQSTAFPEGDVSTSSNFSFRKHFHFDFDEPLPVPVTMRWSTLPGTATQGPNTIYYDFVGVSNGVENLDVGATGFVIDNMRIRGDGTPEGDETFYFDFTFPDGGPVIAERFEITIQEDDACPGAELVRNASAQEIVDGALVGWEEVVGGPWTTEGSSGTEFTNRNDPVAELRQDIDVSGFAQGIDNGAQEFTFNGYIRTGSPDTGRFVLEFRDASNTQILGSWDGSAHATSNKWLRQAQTVSPPPGTRFVRLRMISVQESQHGNDVLFLEPSFRSLAVPSVTLGDTVLDEGEHGISLARFPVTLSCPSSVPVSVGYATADGTATAGEDYQATAGTLTVPAGALTATLEVPVFGDAVVESDETFVLELVNPVGTSISLGRGTATILADERGLTVADVEVAEGDAGGNAQAVFTVELSTPSPLDLRFDYATADGVALAGEDYVSTSGTATLLAGQTSVQVSVPILGDSTVEANRECFTLTLSHAVNTRLERNTAMACILDDDVSVSIVDGSVMEGLTGTTADLHMPVRLSRSSELPITVTWHTADGTAVAGEDYTAASGTLTFEPGETKHTVTVAVRGDEEMEVGELFTVTLDSADGATLAESTASAFIVDDDGCQSIDLLSNSGAEAGVDTGPSGDGIPEWQEIEGDQWHRFQSDAVTALENTRYFASGHVDAGELRQDHDVTDFAAWIDAGTQRFVFTGWLRSESEVEPDAGRVVLEYLAADGSLLDAYDSGEIVSTDAWRQIVDLRQAPVGTRTLRLRLLTRRIGSEPANGAYFDGFALRSVDTPVLWVDPSGSSIHEGTGLTGEMAFTVNLSCLGGGPVSVDVHTTDAVAQRATAGVDFLAVSETLTFEVGGVTRVTVPVTVLGDADPEPTEFIGLVLDNPVGAVVRGGVGEGKILDDDSDPIDRFVTVLNTDPGDGQLVITLGAHGDWGSSPHRDAPEGNDAYFDPLGPAPLGQTTHTYGLLLNHAGYSPQYLTASGYFTDDRLIEPGFLQIGERFATSAFEVDGLYMTLRQEVHDISSDGLRTGGVLVQTYGVTNLLDRGTTFDLTRYFDGDLKLLDTGREDGAGVREVDGTTLVFMIDAPVTIDESAGFVALSADGGVAPEGAHYEVEPFTTLRSHLDNGGAPRNRVHLDMDSDGAVEPALAYDAALALRNRFADIAAGETVTYRAYTFFGEAAFADFTFDLPPVAEAGNLVVGVEGSPITLDGSQSSDHEGPIAAWDWDLDGDGNYGDVSGAIATAPAETQETRFTVGLRVTDSAGQQSFDTVAVVVLNAPPTVTTNPDGTPVYVDSVTTVSGTYADPGVLDTHTATIDWGDGNVEPLTLDGANGQGSFSAAHTYTAGGTFTVEVCVTDDGSVDGGGPATGCDPHTIEVLVDRPPVAEAGDPVAVDEGATATLDASASFDAEGPITAWDWDLDGDGNFDDASGVTAQITESQETTFTVGLRVTDTGGLVGFDTVQVTVLNAPPSVSVGGDTALRVDSTAQISGTYTDPGVLDTHIATVDWGDGTVESLALTGNGSGGGTFDASHAYTTVGLFTVEVCVSDDGAPVGGGPGTGCDTHTLEVFGWPTFELSKTAQLVVDGNLDGIANPGDRIEYRLEATNTGEGPAFDVVVEDVLPAHTTFVDGSVSLGGSVLGTVVETVPVTVTADTMDIGDTLVVTFAVDVSSPLPRDVTGVFNQATVGSLEVDPIPSDDPSTPEVGDATGVAAAGEPGQTTVCVIEDLGSGWTLSTLGDAGSADATLVGADAMAERLHLTGTGTSLFQDADNAVFYHREMSLHEDFRVEVDVTDFPVDTGGEVRKAALMLRAGLGDRDPRVMVTFVPHMVDPQGHVVHGLQFDFRAVAGDGGTELANTRFDVPMGTRLAIEKRGNTYTVLYFDTVDNAWRQPDGAGYHGQVQLDLGGGASGETLLAGMAVASYDAAVPLTAEFAEYTTCYPNADPPKDPPAAGVCDAGRPLDVVYLLDLSGSMTAGFPATSGVTRLEAAQQAIGQLNQRLLTRAGSRAALVTVAGYRTPAENLTLGVHVDEPLTGDISQVDAAVQGFDPSTISSDVTSPLALGLDAVQGLLRAANLDGRQPVVVILSDGIPNIDADGQGPDAYALEELQAISLYDDAGRFLTWGQVGWMGHFNGDTATFDGEPLANVMFEVEALKIAVPDTLVYGITLEGDGAGLGSANGDLFEYAAHFTGGLAYAAADTEGLLTAMWSLANDLDCGGTGTASIAGRVWDDADGDGLETIGEESLTDVRVELYDGAGLGITFTATDANGQYSFDDLPAGTYTVRVDPTTLPPGVDLSTFDGDGVATPDQSTVTVVDGEARGGVSFGYDRSGPTCDLDTFDGTALDAAWQTVDLGDADQGDASLVSGALHLTGDGTSLFHGTDNAAFVHRPESGDLRVETVIADIPVDTGGDPRKACLMARAGIGSTDARVMACHLPSVPGAGSAGVQFDIRHPDGTAEELAILVLNATLPLRLALERSGDVWTVEYSFDDGLSWTQPSGLLDGSVTLPLGTHPLVGLAVASYDDSVTMTAAFEEVIVCRDH